MAEFRMVADCTFTAEDIDDAFSKMRRHFEALENGDDEEDFFVGKIMIATKDDKGVDWNRMEISE